MKPDNRPHAQASTVPLSTKENVVHIHMREEDGGAQSGAAEFAVRPVAFTHESLNTVSVVSTYALTAHTKPTSALMSSQPNTSRESGDSASAAAARTYGVHAGSLEPINPAPVTERWHMVELEFSRETSETRRTR